MARVHFAESPPAEPPPAWEPLFEDISSPSPLPLRRPLDPPPPCFSTLSPRRIRSRDFPPFRIPSVSAQLADGFRMLYPRKILEQHGIHRADWARFLEDLAIAARLSAKGLRAVGTRVPVAPLRAHGIFPSLALSAVYDLRFRRSVIEEVRALLHLWNQCAFERRKIRVTLQVLPIGAGNMEYALLVESL